MSNEQSKTFYLHRSGLETFQRCPRKWWLGYTVDGLGIAREGLDIALCRGTFVHDGLARLLSGEGFYSALAEVLAKFDTEIKRRGLQIPAEGDALFTYQEQRALIEAMLYGWYRYRLPKFLERYEVLETEREEVVEIGTFQTIEGPMRLVWLGKADAIVRERATGAWLVVSFKTTSAYGDWNEKRAMTDVQGLSELWAVEQRLIRWHEDAQNQPYEAWAWGKVNPSQEVYERLCQQHDWRA